MAEHTIKATFGVDTRGGKADLDDMERHAKRAAEGIQSVFAREPLGVRRGSRAIEELTRGFLELGESSGSAVQAVGSFGRALSVGLGGGAAIGITTLIAEKMIQFKEETEKANTEFHNLMVEGSKSGFGKSIGQLEEGLKNTAAASTKAKDELRKMVDPTYLMTKAFMEQMSESEVIAKYRKEAAEADQKSNDYVTKIAAKMRESSNVEETRFRVGEKEAALAEQEIKHQENLNRLAEEETVTGVKRIDLTNEENRADAQARARITEIYDAELKQLRNQEKSLEVTAQIATAERQRAAIANTALEPSQKKLYSDKESLEIAKQRAALAEQELKDAQEYERSVQNRDEKTRLQAAGATQAARGRLEAAQGGVETAASGYANTLAGQMEQRAMSSPQSDSAVYSQRLAQYNQLHANARRGGFNPNMLVKPQMGELDYDPMRLIKASIGASQKMTPEQQMTDWLGPALSAPPGASENELARRRSADSAAAAAGRAADTAAQHPPPVDQRFLSQFQENMQDFNSYWTQPQMQEAQQGMKALNYPGLQSTPQMNIPIPQPPIFPQSDYQYQFGIKSSDSGEERQGSESNLPAAIKEAGEKIINTITQLFSG